MGPWDWRSAGADAGTALLRERRHWQGLPGLSRRLRPAAWILGIALALHAVMLVSDWMLLAGEQRTLRQGMEARFRAVFPEAVAVVDPALQMRRKLAEARHAAGLSDSSDFLPLIDAAAAAFNSLPPGSVRVVSYETGRLTFELGAMDAAVANRMLARLRQSGLRVDTPATGTQPGRNSMVITVRPS
jgi:general secretion pathway protein L